jgi:hypothetical protein
LGAIAGGFSVARTVGATAGGTTTSCPLPDPQEPEGLGIDDVEAAASVHEDLGEPSVADDEIYNERVPPWA